MQKLKAEAEAEKQRMEEERKRLEEEKQKLEEEKKRLEAEKKAEEDKKAEEERLKAEAEAKAKAEAEAEEAKRKADEEEKQRIEAEKKAEEEKRLLTLRIKKVEGTEDDYTCIDGWTNFWYESAENPNTSINQIIVPRIMDSDGVIKDTTSPKKHTIVRQNNTNCGGYCTPSIKGCYVKSTEMLTLQGLKPYDGKLTLSEAVFFHDANNQMISRTMKTTLYKDKMEAKDITNDPKTGWTNEENTKWEGYKPVIKLSYFIDNDAENKIEQVKYHDQSLNKTDAIALYKKIMDYENKYSSTFTFK